MLRNFFVCVIDNMFSLLIDFIAGIGSQYIPLSKSECKDNCTGVMQEDGRDTLDETIITSAKGWTFAFEGGAHILFRYTGPGRRFVLYPISSLNHIFLGQFADLNLGREIVETCQTK